MLEHRVVYCNPCSGVQDQRESSVPCEAGHGTLGMGQHHGGISRSGLGSSSPEAGTWAHGLAGLIPLERDKEINNELYFKMSDLSCK